MVYIFSIFLLTLSLSFPDKHCAEIVRNDVKSSQLAEAISAVARHVTEDQLLTLPSLIAAIANAAIHGLILIRITIFY